MILHEPSARASRHIALAVNLLCDDQQLGSIPHAGLIDGLTGLALPAFTPEPDKSEGIRDRRDVFQSSTRISWINIELAADAGWVTLQRNGQVLARFRKAKVRGWRLDPVGNVRAWFAY